MTIEFKRRGRSRFVSRATGYAISRPTGRGLDRERLTIDAPGRDYNLRFAEDAIWLLDGEREVAYASGRGEHWSVLLGERRLDLVQPKPGTNHSLIEENGTAIGQVAGHGFPLRAVQTDGLSDETEEVTVFLVAVALLGWRESDRALLPGGGS